MPDSVPLTQPGEPTAASVVSRLGEIRQRLETASDFVTNYASMYPSTKPSELFEDARWLVDALDVALADRDRARDLAAALEAENAQAKRLLEEELHLAQYGERAPGGDENWPDHHRAVEHYLRALHDVAASALGYPTTEATT